MNMDASLAPRGRNPIHIHFPGGLPGGNQADHPSKVEVVDICPLRCVRVDHDSNPNRRKPSSNTIRLETAVFLVCFVVKPKSPETVEGPKSSETVVETKSSETVVELFC